MIHEFLEQHRAIDFAEHARASGYVAVLSSKRQAIDKRKKKYVVYVYRGESK